MRRLVMALGVACAFAAVGPTPGQVTTTGTTPGAGAVMPGGQVVSSTATLSPAGSRLPAAAPSVGKSVGDPLMRPYDPYRPLDAFKGTGIDPKSVVAPVTAGNSNLLERLYQKLGSVTGFIKPTVTTGPTYTPGIARRNRERARQRMWRPD